MKFTFSSEQEEFSSNLRHLLADRSPTKEVRRLMETDHGYERDGWHAINTALGLTAIRIPEAYGGYGLSFGDQCIVLEEMGPAVLCAPYFATAVLAAGAVMNGGTEAEKRALLPGIAAGETTTDVLNGRTASMPVAVILVGLRANRARTQAPSPVGRWGGWRSISCRLGKHAQIDAQFLRVGARQKLFNVGVGLLPYRNSCDEKRPPGRGQFEPPRAVIGIIDTHFY